jgi:phosphatidylserine/phosphatidylglycerophosphate/cardiolipin synthase-like enzyme
LLNAVEQAALLVFGDYASLAARVFHALGTIAPGTLLDASRLAKMAALTPSEENGAVMVLANGSAVGILAAVDTHSWVAVVPPHQFARLGVLLDAVGYYRAHVHQDRTEATVVLTRPAKPSQLEIALESYGWKTATVAPTADAFLALAAAAKHRLVVMTPFFDFAGSLWLKRLLGTAPATTERVLILRHLEDPSHPGYPQGYDAIAPWLRDSRVRVFNYALPRSGAKGVETFHAKVVLCDETEAYIGSSNMNQASLVYSMELGVTVRGEAAADAAIIINSILKVAKELQWT